jgi:hypothetical protein
MCPGDWVSQDFHTIDIWNEGGKFYSFLLEAESNPRRLVRTEKLNDPFRGSNPRPSDLYALPQPTTVYRWYDYQLDCSGWPSNTWYWWRGIDCVYVRSQDSREWPLTFYFFLLESFSIVHSRVFIWTHSSTILAQCFRSSYYISIPTVTKDFKSSPLTCRNVFR